MVDSALAARESDARTGQALPPRGFDRLQELMRHGYVPDPLPPSSCTGILLRHPTAPNLVIQPDGNIEVPIGQTLRRQRLAEPPPRKPKRRWLRTIAILIAVAAYGLMAIGITVGVMEGL